MTVSLSNFLTNFLYIAYVLLINAERAEASTSDGVLTLTLPKAEHARARTVKVNAR